MNKIFLITIISFANTSILFAQDTKNKEEKTPVYNYVVDDPMDHAFNQFNENNRAFVYVPEFYSFLPHTIKDTTYSFECYDSRDSIIPKTKIQDITAVRFISEFKSYTDNKHTYKDANGKDKPLPVSSIIRRYDRVGDNIWMCVDYATNKYTQLKESRTYIIRTDTLTATDPATHNEMNTIHCYYKVETIK